MMRATRLARRDSIPCTAEAVEESYSVANREPLAQKILRGDFAAGDRVIAKLRRDALVFEKERLH